MAKKSTQCSKASREKKSLAIKSGEVVKGSVVKGHSTKPVTIARSKLYRLLITEGKHPDVAAKELGCSGTTVRRRAYELSILKPRVYKSMRRKKKSDKPGYEITEIETLNGLLERGAKIEGFIPNGTKIHVVLDSGFGFWIEGKVGPCSREEISDKKEALRVQYTRLKKQAELAGIA